MAAISQEHYSGDMPVSDKAPNKPKDTNSLCIPSQSDFLQPIEDSQDTNAYMTTEIPVSEQPSQNPHPIRPPEATYFARPVLETTEEIAAGFQFQKAPSHTMSHSLGGSQRRPVPSFKSGETKASRDSSPGGSKPASYLGKVECPPSKMPEMSVADHRIDHHGGVIVEPSLKSRKIQGKTEDSNKALDEYPSVPVPGQDTHRFPFPDETRETNPKGAKRISRCSRSPLTKAHLPRTITDARRKALARMSPQNRFSQASVRDARSQRSRVKQQKDSSLAQPVSPEFQEGEAISTRRPRSEASNISKPRAPPRVHHRKSTPTREQNTLNLVRFAESWNANHIYNNMLLDRWEEKITILEEYIASQRSTIQRYQDGMKSRDQKIADLSEEVENMRTRCQQPEDENTSRHKLKEKLQSKLHLYKERLNAAIIEQQQLYTSCNIHCEKATADIITAGQAQKQSLKEVSQTVERIGTEIKEGVASVAEDTHRQVEASNTTIQSLGIELRDRVKELECERQRTKDLSDQLHQSHKMNECSLQSLASQSREILEKIVQEQQQAQNIDISIRKQEQKIDTVLVALEKAKSKTLDAAVVMKNLQDLHDDTVEKIVSGVSGSMELTKNAMLGDHETLSENANEVRGLCEAVGKRIVEDNNIAIWQGKVNDSLTAVQSQVQYIRDLQDKLHRMNTRENEETEEHQELRRQIKKAATNEQAANDKVNDLKAQIENLQKTLSEKDISIGTLNRDLEVVREELKEQARFLQDKERQFQDEREKDKKASELNIQQRTQEGVRAIAEEMEEMRDKHEIIEKQLQEAEMSRAQLEQELAETRQETESSKANIGEDLHQIRGQIDVATASISKLTTGLEESEYGRETLQRSLEGWSQTRAEIGQMGQILGRLGRDQPSAIQMSHELRELLEVQKRLSDTLRSHQVGLAEMEAAAVSDGTGPSSGTATHSIIGLSATNEPQNDTTSARELQNHERKVVVRSPATEDDRVSPMSVEQERSTRRHSAPPRGIMKVATSSALGEVEAEEGAPDMDPQAPGVPYPPPKRKIARRGSKSSLTTHSTYNRPVAGSVLAVGKENIDTSRAGYNENRNNVTIDSVIPGPKSAGSADKVAHVDEPPMKRQRISKGNLHPSQGSNIAERVKLSRSMSAYPVAGGSSNPKPIQEAPSDPRDISLRRGPTQRRQSRLVTYGLQNQSSTNSSAAPDGSQLSTDSSQTMEVTNDQDS